MANRIRGGTVAQWLALLPHSKKVLGSFPAQPGPFCVSLHVLPVFAWVSSGVLRFPPHFKRHAQAMLSITPYSKIG